MSDAPGEHDPALRAFGAQIDSFATGLGGLLTAYELYRDSGADLGDVRLRLLGMSAAIGDQAIDASLEDALVGPTPVYLYGKHAMVAAGREFPLHVQEREILTTLWAAEKPLLTRELHEATATTPHHSQTTGVRVRKVSDTIKDALSSTLDPIGCEIRHDGRRSSPQNYYDINRRRVRVVEIPEDTDPRTRFTEEEMYQGLVDPERITKPNFETAKPPLLLERVDRNLLRVASTGRPIRLITENLIYCVNSLLVSQGFANPDELMSLGFRSDGLRQAKHSFAQFFDAVEGRLNGPRHEDEILITDGLRSPLRSIGVNVRYVNAKRTSTTLAGHGEVLPMAASPILAANSPENSRRAMSPREIAASKEAKGRSAQILLLNDNTVLCGNQYVPLLTDQKGILTSVRDAKEPLGSLGLHKLSTTRVIADPQLSITRARARDFAQALNDALGFEGLIIFKNNHMVFHWLHSGIQVVEEPNREDELREQFTGDVMYSTILAPSEFDYPEIETDNPIEIKILSDRKLMIGDKEIEITQTHILYALNALRVNRGYSTAPELRSFGFRMRSTDFSEAMHNLRDLLNEEGKDKIIMSAGGGPAITHALNPRVRFIADEAALAYITALAARARGDADLALPNNPDPVVIRRGRAAAARALAASMLGSPPAASRLATEDPASQDTAGADEPALDIFAGAASAGADEPAQDLETNRLDDRPDNETAQAGDKVEADATSADTVDETEATESNETDSDLETGETFAALIEKYDEVAALYGSDDADRLHIKKLEEQIAHVAKMDLETAHTMVLLAHLSRELGMTFSPRTSVEPTTLDAYYLTVLDRINTAIQQTNFSHPQDKTPKVTSEFRLALLGLRLGLPPNMPTLRAKNFRKAEGAISTYEQAYGWAWESVRSGASDHLTHYLGREKRLIDSNYNFARTRLKNTLVRMGQSS